MSGQKGESGHQREAGHATDQRPPAAAGPRQVCVVQSEMEKGPCADREDQRHEALLLRQDACCGQRRPDPNRQSSDEDEYQRPTKPRGYGSACQQVTERERLDRLVDGQPEEEDENGRMRPFGAQRKPGQKHVQHKHTGDDEDLRALVTRDTLSPLSPIDDIRADAGYRMRAAQNLVQRALAELGTGS